MSGKVIELDLAENFQTETQSGVVLVDFSATWCRPCQMQLPILNQIAEKMGDAVRVLKIDTDKFGAIAQQYGVSSIPLLLIFKNGHVVESFTGLQDERTLAGALSNHLGTA
ncbi:MAG: thioredoxin [Planctomycetaceae bacterium]|nr:thioredoxin [Planctomycetaceae bacterium]